MGHHSRLRENDDLPLWRAPAIKKKPPFFNVRALITREIMRSKDAQCNTKERPQRQGRDLRILNDYLCFFYISDGKRKMSQVW